jgi:V/A-type H+/Na+-transporting ATPase subunit D
MADIKFTKNELRAQQKKLGQLQKYLPTLQLKKAMLQAEIYEARIEIAHCEKEMQSRRDKAETFSPLLSSHLAVRPEEAARIASVEKRYDNVAGVEVPYFESISFEPVDYQLFDTPAWLDTAIFSLRGLTEARVRVLVAEEKKAALEEELRMVSIRVNLFEKILIPRAMNNIKKIKVFLGDQELAAVSRAKVAKTKIEQQRQQLAR